MITYYSKVRIFEDFALIVRYNAEYPITLNYIVVKITSDYDMFVTSVITLHIIVVYSKSVSNFTDNRFKCNASSNVSREKNWTCRTDIIGVQSE